MITNDKLNQFHNQTRYLKLFTAYIEYRQIDMKQNDQGIDKQIDRSMYRIDRQIDKQICKWKAKYFI